jgi:hypothetical protein
MCVRWVLAGRDSERVFGRCQRHRSVPGRSQASQPTLDQAGLKPASRSGSAQGSGTSWRCANDPFDRLLALAADLIRRHVAVIAALSGRSAKSQRCSQRYRYSLAVGPSKSDWGNRKGLSKMPCKMALVREPRRNRDIGNWAIRAGQEIARQAQASLQHKLVRWDTYGRLERASEMVQRQAGGQRELLQFKFFTEMRVDILLHPTQHPWRQSAPPLRGRYGVRHACQMASAWSTV